jgi:nucleotide-binding universal stress UspA family protein
MASFTMVEDEREAQAYLTRMTELPMLSGLPVKTRLLTNSPALAILDAAAEYRADIIVMTSHGRTGVSRWVFGSVAEHVARQSHMPVLVLRPRELPFWTEGAELVESPKAPAETEPSLPVLHVLVPLDGSPLAEAVLEPAAECAAALVRGVEQAIKVPSGSVTAVLHLVLVVRPIDSVAENAPESLLVSGAQTYLRQAAERTHSAHPCVSITWEVASALDVADYLVTLLEDHLEADSEHPAPVPTDTSGRGRSEQADRPALPPRPYTLLAMATHGRSGITRWVWGSITERVVQKTRLPLLLVHPVKSAEHTNTPGKEAAMTGTGGP